MTSRNETCPRRNLQQRLKSRATKADLVGAMTTFRRFLSLSALSSVFGVALSLAVVFA